MENFTSHLTIREIEILAPSQKAARRIFQRWPLQGLAILDALSRIERRWQRRARRRVRQS
jgi:hypothetical protein